MLTISKIEDHKELVQDILDRALAAIEEMPEHQYSDEFRRIVNDCHSMLATLDIEAARLPMQSEAFLPGDSTGID